MEQHHSALSAAGLRVVAIGIGEPKHVQRYGTQFAPSITCLCYPTPAVHQAYALKHAGLTDLLNLRMATNAVRAAAGGFSQGQSTGDTQQLGGTFVVDQAGRFQYVYRSEVPGDHPDLKRVVLEYQARAATL